MAMCSLILNGGVALLMVCASIEAWLRTERRYADVMHHREQHRIAALGRRPWSNQRRG